MNEFFLIHRGIGWLMCVGFPVVVGSIAVAYVVVTWRDRGRDDD